MTTDHLVYVENKVIMCNAHEVAKTRDDLLLLTNRGECDDTVSCRVARTRCRRCRRSRSADDVDGSQGLLSPAQEDHSSGFGGEQLGGGQGLVFRGDLDVVDVGASV